MLVTQTNLRRILAFAKTNLNNLELLSEAIAEYNAQIERGRQLSGQMSKVLDRQTQRVLELAKNEGGGKGQSILKTEIERQKREIAGLEASIRGQRKEVASRDTLWNSTVGTFGFGTEHSEEAENLAVLNRKLAEAKERTKQLKDAMKAMGAAAAEAAFEGVQTATAPVSLVGDGSETNQRVRDAQLAAMEAKDSGFKGIHELLMSGASGDQLQQYMESLGTGSVGETNAAWDAKDELNQINANGGLTSQEQIDAFAQKIAAASNAAAEAEQQRIDTLEQEKQRIAEIPNVLKSMEGTTVDIKTQLSQLDEETAGPLAGALENIQGRFQAGKMSAEDFTAVMQGLKSATDQATAAAKREEEQKLREQILRGDFSGLNPMQALEDKDRPDYYCHVCGVRV